MKPNRPYVEAAAGKIASFILFLQKKFAEGMSKTSASWKARQQWIFLCSICLLFGCFSIMAMLHPFQYRNTKLQKPSSIHVPQFHADDLKIIITEKEISGVHVFRKRLDSLSGTNEGKTKMQQLMQQRPGLFDSLQMTEQLYHSQKK